MTVPDKPGKRNSSGAKPGWELGEPSPGARIYQNQIDPELYSSFFFGCSTRKDDPWWWDNRAKPGYVYAILRQLTLSSGVLSLREAKLSLSSEVSTNTSLIYLSELTDNPADHEPPEHVSTAGVTTGRVVNLTESEWKYWQRRIRRDREEVWGIDTVYTIWQLDGSVVVVTDAAYTLIGGKVYEGEALISKVLNGVLDTHDRTRRIRGNHGSQRATNYKESSTWKWTQSTREITREEFTEALKELKKEGKVRWMECKERDGNLRHFWATPEQYGAEVKQRLGIVPRAKKKSS